MYNTETKGAWTCLTCGHVVPAAPKSRANDLMMEHLTCGQRDDQYCSSCCDMRTHEFQAQSRGVLSAQQGGAAQPQRPHVLQATPVGATTQEAYAGQVPTGVVQTGVPVGAQATAAVAAQPTGAQAARPDPRAVLANLRNVLPELTTDELQHLKQQIDVELKERTLCTVCCARPKQVILYPCKHNCLCVECAPKVQECPMCRAAIADRITPFS